MRGSPQMKLSQEIYDYINYKEGIYKKGVRGVLSVYTDNTRKNKAEEQAALCPAPVDIIIERTKKFLKKCDIITADNPIICKPEIWLSCKERYRKIKETYCLNDERDIIWMKFTEKERHLGVVASGNDVNFQLPSTKCDYNKKNERKREFNTSGILVHAYGKSWNKEFILVFPLCNIPDGLCRGHIERGIGNYLIKNNVPILDYYSHRIQIGLPIISATV
jgi:hypothetical protein